MKYFGLIVLFYTFAFAHDPNKDETPSWTYYSRFSFVQDVDQQVGGGFYARLKRIKGNQFNDIRLFGNALANDQYVYLRHKSSQILTSYPNVYRFTTVSYEKNTLADVSLRYHYNNGLGYFLQKNNQGNMTAELGLAYDMSDYLNDTWKTSYIKSAFTWDTQLFNFETKLELEYFSQISDIADSDLTRFQALGEVQYPLTKSIYLFVSFIQELSKDASFNPKATTISYSIGWEKPLFGKLLK